MIQREGRGRERERTRERERERWGTRRQEGHATKNKIGRDKV